MGSISFSGNKIEDIKLCEPYDLKNLNTYLNFSQNQQQKGKEKNRR